MEFDGHAWKERLEGIREPVSRQRSQTRKHPKLKCLSPIVHKSTVGALLEVDSLMSLLLQATSPGRSSIRGSPSQQQGAHVGVIKLASSSEICT